MTLEKKFISQKCNLLHCMFACVYYVCWVSIHFCRKYYHRSHPENLQHPLGGLTGTWVLL